jgi:hypothetical protein
MGYEKQTFVKGQVLTATHMNHIESGIEDVDTRKMDRAERTHWEDEGGVHKLDNKYLDLDWFAKKNYTVSELYSEHEVSFSSLSATITDFGGTKIQEGNKYRVYWNGVPYLCEAVIYEGVTFLGNAAIYGNTYPTTEEPFCIWTAGTTAVTVMKETKTAETIRLKVDTVLDVQWDRMPGEFLPDYLPHEEHKGENRIVFPSKEIFFDGSAGVQVTGFVEGALIGGRKYVVNWNGTEYPVTCRLYTNSNGQPQYYLGNSSMIGSTESSPEPFCIVSAGTLSSNGYVYRDTSLGGERITLQINEVAEVVIHKMDGKYLPKGVPYERFVWLIDNETLTLESMDGMTVADYPTTIGLTTGTEYTVIFDGTEYTCTAVLLQGVVFLGNQSILGGDDTGEPFMVLYIESDGIFQIISITGAATATISLGGSVATPIDPEFLPAPATLDLINAGVDPVLGEHRTGTLSGAYAIAKRGWGCGVLRVHMMFPAVSGGSATEVTATATVDRDWYGGFKVTIIRAVTTNSASLVQITISSDDSLSVHCSRLTMYLT